LKAIDTGIFAEASLISSLFSRSHFFAAAPFSPHDIAISRHFAAATAAEAPIADYFQLLAFADAADTFISFQLSAAAAAARPPPFLRDFARRFHYAIAIS
jgi:hypothetical protein